MKIIAVVEDWAEAQDLNTEEGYMRFLEMYPASEYFNWLYLAISFYIKQRRLMTPKTKTILKKILAYALMSIVLMLVYFVVSFLFDWLFDLIGEEKVSWRSVVASCTFTTAAIIIVDILNSRKKGVDRSDDIIKICRRILTTTTYMFCGMLLVEWLIQKFSDKDFSLGLVHWLSFALAVALFDELVKKYKEKKGEKTDN